MTTTQANFRINADTNDQADQIFTLLGITPPQAVNHFYQYVADNVRLPFSVQITLKFKERAHMPNKQQLKVRSWHIADLKFDHVQSTLALSAQVILFLEYLLSLLCIVATAFLASSAMCCRALPAQQTRSYLYLSD